MTENRISFVVSPEVKAHIEGGGTLEGGFVRYPNHCGEFAHIAQAFLWCSSKLSNCRLTDSIPEEGVIICHRRSFPAAFKPSKNQFVVYCKGDWDVHYYAQMHIVQNPNDLLSLPEEHWQRHHLPHFPQPGLLPRRIDRGEIFENVAFVGDLDALSPELQSDCFRHDLRQLGLNWLVHEHGRWHDYRDVDAVVAVRDLRGVSTYDYKPATKLCNAWLAGVPALLGRESAFQALRVTPLDYLEATTYDEVLDALATLKADSSLRLKMQQNGSARALNYTAEAVSNAWMSLITDVLPGQFQAWCGLSQADRSYFLRRRRLWELMGQSRRKLKECLAGHELLYSYV